MTAKERQDRKEGLSKIYDKHFGKAKQQTSHNDAPVRAIEKPIGMADGRPSRAQLMEEAKSKGIKYFRILIKSELQEILVGATPDRIAAIQDQAKARWQHKEEEK